MAEQQKDRKTVKEPLRYPKVAKVPVVMQMEALECGAASLTMVLAYYGKWIPLEQVRLDCGVSRDGSNLKNVYLAAVSYPERERYFPVHYSLEFQPLCGP